MLLGNIRGQLDRIERKLDAHESKHNGHPQKTIKGLTLTQWLITVLVALAGRRGLGGGRVDANRTERRLICQHST